jgi:hypothetical protein
MEVAGFPETTVIRNSLYGVTICIINLHKLYLNSETQQLPGREAPFGDTKTTEPFMKKQI